LSSSDRADLTITVPARPDQLATVRDRLRRWLRDRAVPGPIRDDIVQVADEALANSVEHAYRRSPAPATVDVTVRVDPQTVSVSVTDHGSWKPAVRPHGSYRGRGLAMIRAMAGRVELVASASGTTLTAHFPRGS
jgi:serine/threonine-protein kinase RsbW